MDLKKLLPICILIAAGCSSTDKTYLRDPLPHDPIELNDGASKACRLWKKTLNGRISYIDTSVNGDRIFISTSRERNRRGRKISRLRVLNRRGRLLWSKWLRKPVRSQSMSDTGSLYAANTWGTKLFVYNKHGKTMWEKEHLGRPVILPKTERIIQVNNDDSQLEKAFFNYSFNGTLVSTAKIGKTKEREALEMFFSDDEHHIVATTGGKSLVLFSTDGQLLWHNTFDGKPIEAALRSAPEFKIFVLLSTGSSHKLVALKVKDGEPNNFEEDWSTSLSYRYNKVRLVDDVLYLYGNSSQGQTLAAFNTGDGDKLWGKTYSVPSIYDSHFSAFKNPGLVTVAIDKGKRAGRLNIIGINKSGKAQWDVEVKAPNGLYSYAYSNSGKILVVGTGAPHRGVIEAYNLNCK